MYREDMDVRAARAVYFDVNEFGAGGNYEKPWVAIQVGVVPFTIPNTQSRSRIIQYHDLHHILTGYGTDVRGEAEIGAWSIGAGPPTLTSWWINLMALGFGVVACPIRTWRAYSRGRQSSPLYGKDIDALLARTLGDVRSEMGLQGGPTRAGWRDSLRLVPLAALGLTVVGFMVLITPLLLVLRAAQSARA